MSNMHEPDNAPWPVAAATRQDIPAWLTLAAEVEPLFGPMVGDPRFHAALARAIDGGRAFCERAAPGAPGAPLLGGLLLSTSHAPIYHIGWLAVAARARRRGVGRRLVKHALGLVVPPATVELLTFTAEQGGGESARLFYLSLGFAPAELSTQPPDDTPRQVFRLRISR